MDQSEQFTWSPTATVANHVDMHSSNMNMSETCIRPTNMPTGRKLMADEFWLMWRGHGQLKDGGHVDLVVVWEEQEREAQT
jgi:CO dehydrogenase/acetyl-CoA synthase alpha subunit